MKLLTDTWRQLVQRRLWPVALLLLGALVAVPFLLGKDPAPAPAATAPAPAAAGAVKATAAGADPIVAMVSDDEKPATRRSLGTRHNPFASSAPKKKLKKAKAKSETAQSEPSTDTSQDASSGAGAGSGGASAPTTPSVPKPPTVSVPAQSIVVRFGSSSGEDLPKTRLARNEALSTDDDTPVVVYLGAKNNGKTAIFMVSEGVKPVGDGKCVPEETCEKLELNVGETEFFQLGDSEWEVDLVKIYKHATKVPADESTSSASGTGSSDSSVIG
jgi:hypothetical protein